LFNEQPAEAGKGQLQPPRQNSGWERSDPLNFGGVR